MDNTMTTFADWVSVTARGLGYRTDAQLAAAIGVQQSTVTRWRQGNQPQIRHLVEIARLFKMKIDPLLALSGHVPADLLSDAAPPGSPITESVRRIRDAPLSDMQKHALETYWNHRLDEERTILSELIGGIVKSENASRQSVGQWVGRAIAMAGHTARRMHAHQLMETLFTIEAAPRKRRRRNTTEETLWEEDDIDTPE